MNKCINKTNFSFINLFISSFITYFCWFKIYLKMSEYFDFGLKKNNSHENEFNFNQYKFNSTTDWDSSSRLFCVMYGVLFIIGLLANSIVIFVYAKSSKKYTNFFFINLGISDILILLLCIPVSINDVLYPNEWFLGEMYCKH